MNYFEIISKDFNAFLRARTYLIIAISCCLAFIITLEWSLNRVLDDYASQTISVDKITFAKYDEEPSATFDYRQYVTKTAILISSLENAFYIDRDFKDSWTQILENVQPGDSVKVWYLSVDSYEGKRNRAIHLSVGDKVLLDNSDNDKKGRFFGYILYTALALLVSSISTLYYYRLKHKRR